MKQLQIDMKKHVLIALVIGLGLTFLIVSCGDNNMTKSQNEKNESSKSQKASFNQVASTSNETKIKNAEDKLGIKSSDTKLKSASDIKKTDQRSEAANNKNINYRLEIITEHSECQDCGRKGRDKYLKFPELNFSKYKNEKEIKDLWEKHKKIVENEILGSRGFWDHPVLGKFGSIVKPECSRCGGYIFRDKKSTFQSKTFEIK